jgi:hypothetical protein
MVILKNTWKKYSNTIQPVSFRSTGSDAIITKDNGIRHTPFEAMTNLEPYFMKPHGTVTAANSAFIVSTSYICHAGGILLSWGYLCEAGVIHLSGQGHISVWPGHSDRLGHI